MKKLLSIFLILSIVLVCNAQDFNKYFEDATLRLDYIFSGNVNNQFISIDELSKIPRWYGKRNRLSEVPVEGNGRLIVRELNTNKILYYNSFSTLFQEWLSYDEAKVKTRAFQNVFLMPFPKEKVNAVSYTHLTLPTN